MFMLDVACREQPVDAAAQPHGLPIVVDDMDPPRPDRAGQTGPTAIIFPAETTEV